MDNWQESMEKSSAVIQQAMPVFREMLNDSNLKILQVEKTDNEVWKHLDTGCGIDYLSIRSNGITRGIAWRAQWVDAGKEYNSFTVRRSRETGTETEFEKRKKAIEKKGIYPHYAAQAFIDKKTGEILSLALSTTNDILKFIETETKVSIRKTGAEQNGQADFYVIYWTDMKAYGYNILVYRKNIGIC